MSTKGNRTHFSEDFILRAHEASRAAAENQPQMALELLQQARTTLKSIHAFTIQPVPLENRAVLAKFQDESFIIIRMVDQVLRARNGQIPYQETELIGPDGHPLSWRALMENISRQDSVANRIMAAHPGTGTNNPTDPTALESAIQEAKRHAVNTMYRLPLDYRDCFQHLQAIPQPGKTYQTAVFHDGSRIMWARSREANPRQDKPLAALAIPPDPG